MAICPVCNGPLLDRPLTWFPEARALIVGDKALIFNKYPARIFDALWSAMQRGAGLTGNQLLDLVYFDDPSGGPDSGTIAISVMIHRMRRQLNSLGLFITSPRGKGEAFYRLVGR